MANPQLKKGYTSIAHEIMRAFMKLSINGTQFRLLCVLLEKTYGWHKTVDAIAISQFEKDTGITNNRLITRELHKLENRNIIMVERSDGLTNLYKFNKDYDQWDDKHCLSNGQAKKPHAQMDTSNNAQMGTSDNAQTDTSSSVQTDTYKRNIIKETSLKEIYLKERQSCADAHPARLRREERFALAEQTRDYFYSAYKKNLGKEYKPNSDRHISVFRKLCRTWSAKDLRTATDQFFWYFRGDDWMTQKGFSIREFSNKLGPLLSIWNVDTPKEKEDIDVIRQYHIDAYNKKYSDGLPYSPQLIKDRRIFRELLKNDSVEELKILIDRLFASKDKFIQNSSYYPGLFASQIANLKCAKFKKEETVLINDGWR